MTCFKRIVTSSITLVLFAATVFSVSLQCHNDDYSNIEFVRQKKKMPEKLRLTVYVDDGFSAVEKRTVKKGIREWERATNGMVTFDAKDGWSKDDDFNDIPDRISVLMGDCTKAVHVARFGPEDPLVQKIEKEVESNINGFAHGNCESEFVLLVIGDGRIEDDATLQQTTTHELGHILRLVHTDATQLTIMFPNDFGATNCVTTLDLMQLCEQERFDCDVSKMQPCVPATKSNE